MSSKVRSMEFLGARVTGNCKPPNMKFRDVTPLQGQHTRLITKQAISSASTLTNCECHPRCCETDLNLQRAHRQSYLKRIMMCHHLKITASLCLVHYLRVMKEHT